MAIGIVSFAFMALLGLLPAGMKVFRESMQSSVTSQIAQRVINEAQQTDFAELIKDAGGSTINSGSGRKAVRYFDDQATELAANASQQASAIYWVNTRISPGTTLPGTTQANSNLATVIVQVALNPSRRNLEGQLQNNLWTTNNNLQITSYTALVSRNQ